MSRRNVRAFWIADCELRNTGSSLRACNLQSAIRNFIKEPGFTFVELIIASTMMAILFVGLGGHLRAGVEVWRRATTMGESLQQQRVAFERLERDLANGFLYDPSAEAYSADQSAPKPLPPQFTGDSLQWFTVASLGQGQLARVQIVRYVCETIGNAQGLWRKSWGVMEARAHQEPKVELLLPGCQTMKVSYAYVPEEDSAASLVWMADWKEPSTKKQLPKLVRVELTTQRAAGKETALRIFQRTLTIPSGVLEKYSVASGAAAGSPP